VNKKWNLLVNPSDNNIADRIIDFAVPLKQENIFGENVTQKMVTIIQGIH